MTTANATRWSIVVSTDTDKALRQFLAAEGKSRKGELSRFVEEAVNQRIFELAAKAAKVQNTEVDPEELEAAIDESLAWARARRR